MVYKEPEREKFLKDLADALQQGHVNYQYYGCFEQPGVYGKAYYKVLSETKMGLNYSRRNDVTLYSSDRIVQLTGNGLLTFSPRIPGFEKLYTEQEVVYFDDQFDLARKIQFFDQNPEQAEKIAKEGWEKTRKSFNAKRITQFMVEVTFKQPLSEDYEWSHEVYA
ncbi:glycosyl transferases group 1 family protein [Acinetobacter sp. 742879]|nr:glycosyl transferases group 1 family protein [Acinetobacter sp. 742879]